VGDFTVDNRVPHHPQKFRSRMKYIWEDKTEATILVLEAIISALRDK
jgi:hypothetical protein